MKTLLLYSSYTDQLSYYNDWVDAFAQHPGFNTLCVNVFNGNKDLFSSIKRKVENYELIVLHHSMNGDTLKYLEPFVESLKNRTGKLISFVGNEVNLPIIGMAQKIDNLKEIEPDFIATQLLEEAGKWLYQDCKKSKVISLPHALNPKVFFPKKNFKDRKIDIGTRSARYGVYIGDNDRNNIIDFFYKNSSKLGLNIDLGLDADANKKFNREGWVDFLSSCKATLSTEAGSFFLEKDDKIVKEILQFLSKQKRKIIISDEMFLKKVFRPIIPNFIRKRIIPSLKNYIVGIDVIDQDYDFNEIYEKFFLTAEKAPVYTKAISSRHFDAIGTKTLNVMYAGRYNDILVPRKHYFELKKDGSNISDLTELLRDEVSMQNITECAYEYIISNHTYTNRLNYLLSFLS